MYHYSQAGNVLWGFGGAGCGVERAEHTEPGFLQDGVSRASHITRWFDDKLEGHTVGTGEGTSRSSCPKGALDGQGPLPGESGLDR